MAFDVIVPKKLGRGAITATPTISTFYTVPALSRSFLKDIDICNTGTTTLFVTLYLVPSGSTPLDENKLLHNIAIAPSGLFQWTGTQILNAGDTIQAVGSITGATINISGAEAV